MTLRLTGPALPSLLALVAVQSLSSRSAASPPKPSSPIDLHHGVIVVACSPAVSDQAWSLAGGVYRNASLRPASVDEQTVRVLAGDQPDPRAPRSLQELARSRTALDPLTAAAPRVADSVAKELGVSGLLLVHEVAPGYVRARLYRSADRSFYPIDLWPVPDAQGNPSWETAVHWLQAHAEAAREQRISGSQSAITRSGWFWGALGAAAGAAVLVYATTRDDGTSSSNTIHINGRVGP